MVSALIDPVDGVSRAVESRKWVLPLAFLALSASASGAAFALRGDGTPSVVKRLTESGEMKMTSERELGEAVQQAERVKLISGVAKGVFGMPLGVLALAVVLKLCGWLFGAKAPFHGCFTAAAIAMLPVAVYHLILASALLRQVGVTEDQLSTLVPSSLAALKAGAPPKLASFYAGIDFFNLWSTALLGLGFASASGMRKRRALALAFVLYAAYVGVFMVGLPGLASGMGPGPGGPRG